MKFLKLLIILSIGCRQTTDIVLPSQPPRLVVNCVFTNDRPWEVFVSSSVNPGSYSFALDSLYDPTQNTLQKVTDAQVWLYANDSLIGQANHTGKGRYVLAQLPRPGIQYHIRVAAPGFPEATATNRLPDTAGISLTGSMDTLASKVVAWGDPYYQVPMTITSHLEKPCYVAVNLVYYDSAIYPTYIDSLYAALHEPYTVVLDNGAAINSRRLMTNLYEINSENIDILLYLKSFYFNSNYYTAATQGENMAIKNGFMIDYSIRKYIELYARLRMLSPALYDYTFSAYSQQLALTDPFAGYLPLKSNINGGYGIFGGYRTQLSLIFNG